MTPKYDLDKIKFIIDERTFKKAVDLYESGAILNFSEDAYSYSAKVKGSGGNVYGVYVSLADYTRGDCSCYLGRNDELCKHMVAVAIRGLMGGRALLDDDKKQTVSPVASGKKGELSAGAK